MRGYVYVCLKVYGLSGVCICVHIHVMGFNFMCESAGVKGVRISVIFMHLCVGIWVRGCTCPCVCLCGLYMELYMCTDN